MPVLEQDHYFNYLEALEDVRTRVASLVARKKEMAKGLTSLKRQVLNPGLDVAEDVMGYLQPRDKKEVTEALLDIALKRLGDISFEDILAFRSSKHTPVRPRTCMCGCCHV